MAAAAPETRPWADLDAALVREIFWRVPCLLDRRRAFRACPGWLAALPPALPSLLFPAPNPMGSHSLVCSVHEEDHHCRQRHPTRIPGGARCFGCHEGGWLFLGVRDPFGGHPLLNIRTGAALDLPRDIRDPRGHTLFNIHTSATLDLPRDMVIGLYPLRALARPMTTIHAVALSAAPDNESCVAVCIVTTASPPEPSLRCVARWRVGMRQQFAFEIRPPPGPRSPYFNFLDAEDLVYHDGAFHLLLSRSADIWVCTPQLRRDTEEWENRRFFHPGGRTDDHLVVRGRYLVSSRRQLLLVVRLAPAPRIDTLVAILPAANTSTFKVFRAIERPYQMPEVDPCFPVASYPWAWSELDSLDGRILFVGCGCSRSYDLIDLNDEQGPIQYKGFKPGIYFLDNQEFYFLDAEQYLCRDNGRWSEPNSVQQCIPRADPSWISPPAWLLP